MISIDKFAYISGLRKTNPMEKFIFSMGVMVISVLTTSMATSLIIVMLMGSITIIKGKVPIKYYGELMLIPLTFLVIGLLTISINVVKSDTSVLFKFTILGVNLGCTKESIQLSLNTFAKAMASVSCLYFLALTTPMFEVLMVLKKFKVPSLFIELMSLIYRFIFTLLDTANTIFISQNCRLGYSNLRGGYNSLGSLIASLFITSYKKSKDVYIAMESRCYNGEIRVIEEEYPFSKTNVILIIVIEGILVLIELWTRYPGGLF